jgi:uncharacterized membrane protein YtjA (UPF0391 family)
VGWVRRAAKSGNPWIIVAFSFRNHAVGERRRRHVGGDNSTLFTWAISCLLLSWVSAIFAFGGTAGDAGGRYARMVMMGFLVVALVMLFIRRRRRDR